MSNLVPFRSVVIFGGAGFIGSNWAHHLLKTTDARVHIYDNLSRSGVEQNLQWLERESAGTGRLKITIGDTRNASQVARAVQAATEIYHFAAQVAVTTSITDPRLDFDVNVGGTVNVLEAARSTGRRPFLLFTSTNKVYGAMTGRELVRSGRRYTCLDSDGTDETQPLDFYSPYGCSKGAADQYVRDYSRMFGIPTVVFRMSCIAGARQFGNEDQGWVAHFLYSALQGSPLVLYGDGRQVRDVLCVDDLVSAFEAVSTNSSKTAGQIYNVGGGCRNAVSLLELIEQIETLTGKRLQFKRQSPRPGDQLLYITNYRKLTHDVGWTPKLDIKATLEVIYEWWRSKRKTFGTHPAVPALPNPNLQEVPGAVQ